MYLIVLFKPELLASGWYLHMANNPGNVCVHCVLHLTEFQRKQTIVWGENHFNQPAPFE